MPTVQKPTRQHHYLPQMYQRPFANAKGAVRVLHVDGSRDYTTGTAVAFVEKDYYTVASVDAEEDRRVIEHGVYGQAEKIAAPAHRHLVEGVFPPDPQERMDFAGFMALQKTRGPNFREFSNYATNQMGKAMQMGMAIAPDDYWEAKRVAWEADLSSGPEPPGPFTKEQKDLLARGEMFNLASSKQGAVEMSFVAFDQMTTIFYMMDWALITFEEPWLLTGPEPLNYWRRSLDAPDMMGIGPITSDEVQLPLSPTAALVLTHPPHGTDPNTVGDRDRVIRGGRRAARRINWVTLLWNDVLLLSPDAEEHPLPVIQSQAEAADGVVPRPTVADARLASR
jgi:uncharacterized protein DUF4238